MEGGDGMTTDPEVYELDRIAADNWRKYKASSICAINHRKWGYDLRANLSASQATSHMQAAMRAEIQRKALLKGWKK